MQQLKEYKNTIPKTLTCVNGLPLANARYYVKIKSNAVDVFINENRKEMQQELYYKHLSLFSSIEGKIVEAKVAGANTLLIVSPEDHTQSSREYLIPKYIVEHAILPFMNGSMVMFAKQLIPLGAVEELRNYVEGIVQVGTLEDYEKHFAINDVNLMQASSIAAAIVKDVHKRYESLPKDDLSEDEIKLLTVRIEYIVQYLQQMKRDLKPFQNLQPYTI